MNALTREQAIDVLIGNDIFAEKHINTKAAEFYIKYLMSGRDICDIDRMAWLNTLFGYDIGEENADKIDSELWCNEKYWDECGLGFDILELEYTDKDFIKGVCKELNLEVSFDKWATDNIPFYEYY